jgi:hypothetical protein
MVLASCWRPRRYRGKEERGIFCGARRNPDEKKVEVSAGKSWLNEERLSTKRELAGETSGGSFRAGSDR